METKALKVKPSTHQVIKTLAAASGKTIDEYLSDLVADHGDLESRFAALGQRSPIVQAEPTEQERLEVTGVKGA